ncbi:hypothetical protein ABZ622_16050 [Streptomyces sp. NPDC007164]|uniref:hypothetical protein n=1 Tax=Streptomyces sp. NPDC007164 TaxID=3156918 RepID=UPI00340E8B33
MADEVRADPVAARRCEGTADAGTAPSAEVGVATTSDGADIDRQTDLAGRAFLMPGVAEGEDSAMSLLHHFEHEPLRGNRITLLSRDGGLLRPRRTGECDGVNFYDGSKAPTRVVIEGEFLFRDADGGSPAPVTPPSSPLA